LRKKPKEKSSINVLRNKEKIDSIKDKKIRKLKDNSKIKEKKQSQFKSQQ